MAAKKKGAAKKTAKRAAVPKGKAKPRAAAKGAARRPAAKSAGARGDVTYSDVLHQLRDSLVARLIR